MVLTLTAQEKVIFMYLVISEVVSFLQFLYFGENLVSIEVINAFYITLAIIQDSYKLYMKKKKKKSI